MEITRKDSGRGARSKSGTIGAGGAIGTIGIIGGSGVYDLDGLEDVEELALSTPFGAPSDPLTLGRLGDVRLIFVPRHGKGHQHTPSEVPYRANIWALRKLGATMVLSVSAVGSLRGHIAPGHVVVPDQVIDRTKGVRPSTFFDRGVVAHVQFGDPYCAALRRILVEASRADGARVHDGGTLVCMEGPQFSTRAESLLYRAWGADVIGMTVLPEAKLAREAELCYATLALPTDYDCWHEAEDAVSVEAVLAVLQANAARARRIVRRVVANLAEKAACGCGVALRDAILTARAHVSPEARARLALFLER